jgi:hypothetical protein
MQFFDVEKLGLVQLVELTRYSPPWEELSAIRPG